MLVAMSLRPCATLRGAAIASATAIALAFGPSPLLWNFFLAVGIKMPALR